MLTPAKSKAEEKLAESQRKYKQAVSEMENARRKEAEQTASLRALRLAKEAADKDAAEDTAAKNWAANSK